jgi:hypothetical protein
MLPYVIGLAIVGLSLSAVFQRKGRKGKESPKSYGGSAQAELSFTMPQRETPELQHVGRR